MRPGRLCALRGAQPPPQRSDSRSAGLTDHGGPGPPAVADGFALRLGELAVAVALHRLRRRCDESLMGLHAFSEGSQGGTGPKAKNRAEASPQRRGFAGSARLRLAPMKLTLLDLAQTLASAARLAPFIASSWSSVTASAARLAVGAESEKSR